MLPIVDESLPLVAFLVLPTETTRVAVSQDVKDEADYGPPSSVARRPRTGVGIHYCFVLKREKKPPHHPPLGKQEGGVGK